MGLKGESAMVDIRQTCQISESLSYRRSCRDGGPVRLRHRPGKVMEGEGVVNFSRAFQHAGAQSVLVSLWEVASLEAVEFMTEFYGHLKEGTPRSEALKLARRAIKAKYPQPFFWAVFILHGEG